MQQENFITLSWTLEVKLVGLLALVLTNRVLILIYWIVDAGLLQVNRRNMNKSETSKSTKVNITPYVPAPSVSKFPDAMKVCCSKTFDDIPKLTAMWESCFDHRQRMLREKTPLEYFNMFPYLKESNGYTLVSYEFFISKHKRPLIIFAARERRKPKILQLRQHWSSWARRKQNFRKNPTAIQRRFAAEELLTKLPKLCRSSCVESRAVAVSLHRCQQTSIDGCAENHKTRNVQQVFPSFHGKSNREQWREILLNFHFFAVANRAWRLRKHAELQRETSSCLRHRQSQRPSLCSHPRIQHQVPFWVAARRYSNCVSNFSFTESRISLRIVDDVGFPQKVCLQNRRWKWHKSSPASWYNAEWI